jgi:hypothetical protein
MKKPMYALHHDSAGKVLNASSFTHSFQRGDWLKGLDIRDGDKIEFHDAADRPEFDEVEAITPAFIETPAPAPTPAPVGDDQPF